MSRYKLTPVPSVRMYRVDRIVKDGSTEHVKTFDEHDRDKALALVARLNGAGGRRC